MRITTLAAGLLVAMATSGCLGTYYAGGNVSGTVGDRGYGYGGHRYVAPVPRHPCSNGYYVSADICPGLRAYPRPY